MLVRQPTILVVEDEPLIALDLAAMVEDAGGEVVGPAGSVREALALLDARIVTGAILDVNLSDGDVEPVAEFLLARGAPVIFHTGREPPRALREHFPDLIFHLKPQAPETLIRHLATLIEAKGPNWAGVGGHASAA